MPSVGTAPVYQLKVNSLKGTTTGTNILYYFNTAASPSAIGSQNLKTVFEATVIPVWKDLIASLVTMVSLETRRLNNLTDFHVEPLTGTGGQNGDGAPNFVSFKISKIRTTKETKSGWLQIMGVRELDTTTGGNALEVGAFGRLTTLANTLFSNLAQGGDTFTPVIVGNIQDNSVVPPVTRPESQWIYQNVSAMVPDPDVSSQVSRKV